MALKKKYSDFVAEVRAKVMEIDVDQLVGDYPDALIIDVRESDERAAGYIPNSIHIPRGILERDLEKIAFNGRVSDDELNRPIVCCCRTGQRSVLAAKTLMDMGFQNAISLSGGFMAWNRSGQPVESNQAGVEINDS